MRATTAQLFDMLALGVQCVGGDHDIGQVGAGQGVEQWRERGDLVGLALHLDLSQDGAGVVVDRREQVPAGLHHPVGVGVSGASQSLAVHGEHTAPPGGRDCGGESLDEGADHGVEPVGVHPSDQPAGSRFRGAASVYPEGDSDVAGQVSDPFGDRDERACSGRDRAHRSGEDHDQAVPDPATPARIDHPGQSDVQAGGEEDRLG